MQKRKSSKLVSARVQQSQQSRMKNDIIEQLKRDFLLVPKGSSTASLPTADGGVAPNYSKLIFDHQSLKKFKGRFPKNDVEFYVFCDELNAYVNNNLRIPMDIVFRDMINTLYKDEKD